MKFLHTADWHIGKKLHGYDLLAEQQSAFQEMLKIAEAEKVDAIVVAGDLYDRSMPATDAVEVFNEMMIEMNIQQKFPVLAISGNHDSSVRLATASPWLETLNFHLNTSLWQAFQPIEMQGVQFFLLPYFEPFQARQYFQDETIKTIEEAMIPVVKKMQEAFKPEMQQVLVAHFFAAGSSTTDSETKVTVGGLDAVPIDLLAPFDYVALGHLHSKNALQADRIKYSGTLLKFSLSEVNQCKGVYVVELFGDSVEAVFHEITPLRDVEYLEGDFQELMSPEFYQTVNRDNYLGIRLTNQEIIPNVMQHLRTVYPHILQLERVGSVAVEAQTQLSTQKIEGLNPATLFADYFAETTGNPLSEQQSKWLAASLSAIQKEE